jgi:uncharacterized membrane protein YhiD involved in acid resistance
VNPDQVLGLFVALILGALIGLERQYRKHPAGLHTNALVALGAAAFVIAGTLVGNETGGTRVAGLGFILWATLVGGLILIANIILHFCEHTFTDSK